MKNLWKESMRKDEQRWQIKGIKKWERVRQKGKRRFIIKHALMLCILLVLLTAVTNWIVANGLSIKGAAPKRFYEDIVGMLLTGIIGGWISGTKSWELMETRYKNSIGNRQI